jgi:excisionase family DNA binding protein
MTILTPEEAATFLKVTKRTLQRHKSIPRTMVGGRPRFIKEDLEQWLRRSTGATPRLVVHRNKLFGA